MKFEGSGDYRKDRVHINIYFLGSEGREPCKDIEVGRSSETDIGIAEADDGTARNPFGSPLLLPERSRTFTSPK